MIVILSQDLFVGDAIDDEALIEVIAGGRDRYCVLTRPAYRPGHDSPVERWRCKQVSRLQDRIKLVLERGLKEYEYLAGTLRISIESRDQAQWPDDPVQNPVQLPLSAAQAFLRQPLRLLLENGRNDWGFLKKSVPQSWRARWEQAISRDWIESQMGGGLEEMHNIINQQIVGDGKRRLRTFAVFDSDGRRNDDTSKSAREIQTTCEEWRLAYRMLRRRAIENYIPRETLFDWAVRQRSKQQRDEMQQWVRAYCAMTDEQRHYFNIKKGFDGDGQTVSAIYDSPSVERHGPLKRGMGPIAQEVWGDNPYDGPVYQIREEALDADGSREERVDLFQAIFARL